MVSPVTEKAPQRQFASLDEFVERQNNFFYHFVDGAGAMTPMKMERPVYQRFVELHPELCAELRAKTTDAFLKHKSQKPREGQSRDEFYERDYKRIGESLPREDLFRAYQLMSELVDCKDPYVVGEDGKPKDDYLVV